MNNTTPLVIQEYNTFGSLIQEYPLSGATTTQKLQYVKATGCLHILTNSHFFTKICNNFSVAVPAGPNYFAANENYIALNMGEAKIKIYDASSFTLMRTLNLTGYKDIELQGEVLYYMKNGFLYQYHVTIGDFMHSVSSPLGDSTGLHFFNNGQQILMYHF